MELKLRLRSSATPTEYSVAALERGAQVSNLSAILDSHYALYPAMVFAYKTTDTKAAPTGNEFVQSIWYPIISDERHTNGNAGPSFRIVVKERMGVMRVRDLPTGLVHKVSQSGMFLDGFHALGGDERRLLESSFPKIDFKDVLLFQTGRQRSSIPAALGLLGGGLVLVLLPGTFWIRQFRRRRSPSKPADRAT